MESPPLIETSRLRLRRPALADSEGIFDEYAQDPAVTRYLSWRPHQELDTVRTFLSVVMDAMTHGHRQAWVITASGANRPIGMIDLHIESPRIMVGYVLARTYWGKGYMAEALKPTVEWALGEDGVDRVWAFCDVENRASARVLEKVGMIREGVLRKWFVHPNISDSARDCYSYSRVKGDA